MPPVVSIITPVYNRGAIVQETIESVMAQTFTDWEMLVVDDHSTDNTRDVVMEFASRDARIRWIESGDKPKGASASRNAGLELAAGTYVMFLDSDDLLSAKALEHRVAAMSRHPHLDLAVYPSVFFTDHPSDATEWWNVFTDQDDLDRFLVLDVVWTISGPIWKRAFLEKHALRFDPAFLSNQDWEFHVRALLEHPAYKKFPEEPDTFIRRNIDTVTISRSHQTTALMRNRIEFIRKKILPLVNQKDQKRTGKVYFTLMVECIRALNKGVVIAPEKVSMPVTDEGELRNLRNTYRYFRVGRLLHNVHPKIYQVFRKLFAEKMFNRNFYGVPAYRTALSAAQCERIREINSNGENIPTKSQT